MSDEVNKRLQTLEHLFTLRTVIRDHVKRADFAHKAYNALTFLEEEINKLWDLEKVNSKEVSTLRATRPSIQELKKEMELRWLEKKEELDKIFETPDDKRNAFDDFRPKDGLSTIRLLQRENGIEAYDAVAIDKESPIYTNQGAHPATGKKDKPGSLAIHIGYSPEEAADLSDKLNTIDGDLPLGGRVVGYLDDHSGKFIPGKGSYFQRKHRHSQFRETLYKEMLQKEKESTQSAESK